MSDFADTRVQAGREPVVAYAANGKSGDAVDVWINGVVVNVKCARDITPVQFDLLLINRTGMYWVAVARLGTAAVTPQSTNGVPPSSGSLTTGTTAFDPVETRSYRSFGWRFDTDDVYQGQYGGNGNHTGCAFYGSGPRSLAGATVLDASIQVRRKNAGGITAPQSTTLRLVTEATRPGGAPTLGASTGGPSLAWGQAASFGIPASWAQAMVNGTSGGLALFVGGASPYVIFDGRSHYSPSFTMIIRWQR
jgi:hypothetical protein